VGGLTLLSPPAHAVPAALTLSVDATGTNIHTVVLNWVAPYDDAATGTGRAKAYDVRYSTSPITDANFNAATQADMTIAPQPAGDSEKLYVNNLANGTTYYFAGKTIATDGSTSAMSNVVNVATGPQPGVVQQVTVNNLDDLQAQIDAAPPQGVVITLAKGDYQESSTIQFWGKNNITVQGETNNPADTVIRGEGMNGSIQHNMYVNASSYVTIKNLTLRDSYYHAIQVANGSQYFHADNIVGWNNGEAAFKISAGEWGVEHTDQYSDYGIIENCHIGFDDHGVRSVIEGIDGVATKGWVVRNTVAENIRDVNGSIAYAMYFKGGAIDSVFENNVVINSDIGISFGDGSSGYTYFRYGDTAFEHRGGIIANNIIKSTSMDTGIVLRGATGFKVYNNTVWNTDNYYYNSISLRKSDVVVPAGYPEPQPTRDGEIVNNIFRFAIEPDYGSTSQQLASSIVMHNNLAGGQSVSTGLDPSMFVDAAGGDFHLTAAATAAIGQGANLYADVPTDFDGVARPASGAFDIGAYQYAAAPSSIHVRNQQELLDAITAAHTGGQPTGIIFDNDIPVDQTMVVPSGTTATFSSSFKLNMTSDTSTIDVAQGANLTIDGITVTADPAATGTGVVVDGNLTLTSGAITGNTGDGCGGVTVNTSGTFAMTGGTISGNSAGQNGGGVCNSGLFHMTGGTISNNSAGNYGGGVYSAGPSASFILDDGTISGNSAVQSGGGVYNTLTAPFTMNGGEITTNDAHLYYGGGVSNTEYGNFNLNGGKIDANTTGLLGGGGVFNNTNATLTMTGGDIFDNHVGTNYVGGTAPNGGGVYNGSTGVFYMSGGNVYNNRSVSGGGVFNGGGTTSGVFTMSGGTIIGNTASYPGGGVYNGGDFTMTAGEISGNTAAVDGGGVWNGAAMIMSGGSITDNNSPNGGGIYNSDITSLVIGGTGTVTNNTYTSGGANNVILPPGAFVTLGDGSNGADAPSTMSVGVTKVGDNGVVVASGASASDTAYFTSDVPDQSVLFDTGQIRIGVQSVTGITLDQTSLHLTVGSSATLTATVAPDDATNRAVSWTSNNGVATVDSSGTVTAVSVGNATITVTTYDGNFTATCLVSVTAAGGVAGALTSDDSLVPWSGNGGYDATHYNIDLTYSPANGTTPYTISATTTMDATVTGPALSSFGLDLLGLDVSSVTVNGTAAGFNRIQDAANNMYKLVVNPATAISGNFTVAVTYSGTPQQFIFAGSSNFTVGWVPDRSFTVGGVNYASDGGGVGLGEPVGAFAWYPVNATPADKASYTTSLTAPNAFTAIGIGSLVSTTPVGADQTRWTWDEPDAVPSSFTIAAIGAYQRDTDTHTTPGGAVVPIEAYTDPALTNGGQVPAHYIDLTKQLLDWGENYFGPYQPAVAGYVMKPIGVSYALEVYGKPFYTGDYGDSTYIHEFAHQWGGNSASVADWSDLWLAEGFATYMPWLWNEDQGGSTVNDQAMAVYNLPDTNPLWTVAPAGMTSQSQMFGSWNYQGGALALAALRQGIGPDLMQQVMYDWFTQNAGGNVTTQDFIDLAESVSGADLTQWAHDYLYTAGKPPSWPAPLSYLPPSLASISVTTPPNRTTFTVGDTLDLTGLAVTASYSDGASSDVTANVTTVPANGATLTTAGSQTVTVSYTEGGVTKTTAFDITVTATPQMDAQVLNVAYDLSSAGNSPVTWSPGDPAVTIPADQTFWLSIEVKNTGAATWGHDTGQMPASFLSRNPDYNTTFGTYFMSPYQEQTTVPGDTFTYESGLRAPSAPGTYTMTWQLAQWTTLSDSANPYTAAPFFGPPVTVTVNVVARTDSPPPTPARQPGVLDVSDFQYVGSFALPDVPGVDPPDDKTFLPSGITLRTVSGEQRLILATGTYGQSLYEVAVPAPGKVVGNDFSAVPTASLRNVFGPLTVNSTATSNGTMWYDQSTSTLYWTNYHFYLNTGIDFPVLQAGSLDGGTLTRTGQWYQPDDLDGAPFKSFWGGVTSIPQDFADEYTGGRTLGLGFGGQYNINADVSWGPAIAAVALPLTGTTMDEQPIFNYSISNRAPRDGNYFNTAPHPTTPWAGISTADDTVSSGVFVDLPDKKGYITFMQEGINRIAYDYGGGTWNGQKQNVWNVYSYDSLGQAATGAVPRESVVPSSVGYVTLPNDSSPVSGQRIGGSAFDPTTRLLYVYSLGAEPASVAGTMYNQPLVHVYYVTQDLSFASLTVTKTFGDAPFTNPLTKDPGDVVGFTSSNPSVATVDSTGQVTIVGVGTATITASAPAKMSGGTARYDVVVSAKSLSAATVAVAGPVSYTGLALTPAVTVTVGGVTLVEGTDYTVAYSSNTNAGTATVTVTGIGNYAGTATQQFTIAPRVVSFTIDPVPDQAYTGSPISPPVVVRDGTAVLSSANYTVAYSNNVAVGTATITVTGAGNYAGSTGSATFAITTTVPPAQPQTLTFAQASVTKTFGDAPFTNALTHVGGGALSYTSTNPAVATVDQTGQVTIVGVGSVGIAVVAAAVPDQWLEASASYTLAVGAASLSSATVSVAGPVSYTGSPVTPAVTVTVGGVTLVEGTDYTVAYSSNTNAGTATATVTGIGNYAGTATQQFTIAPRVVTFTVDPVPDQAYTGQAIQPSVVVRDGTTALTTASYTLAFANNVNIGTATITVTGAGNYAGSTGTATFTITPAAPFLTLSSSKWTTGPAVTTTQVTVTTNQTGWTATSDQTWLTVTSSGGTIGLSAAANPTGLPRTATVTVQAGGLTATLSVIQAGISSAVVTHDGARVTTAQLGWTVVAVASGFQPGESVRGSMHSLPLDLGVKMADSNGQVKFTWDIPADTPGGQHAFIATGQSVTVQAAFAVAGPVPSSGGSGSIVVQTGGTPMPNLGGWTIMLLVTAAAVLVVLRRRYENLR